MMSDEDIDKPYPDCPICSGQVGFMGWLGNLKWFHCLFCGMEFSVRGE